MSLLAERWDKAQADRSSVSTAAIMISAPGCALSADAAVALKNVTEFSAAMAKAGLSGKKSRTNTVLFCCLLPLCIPGIAMMYMEWIVLPRQARDKHS
jgi:hypothetical protein